MMTSCGSLAFAGRGRDCAAISRPYAMLTRNAVLPETILMPPGFWRSISPRNSWALLRARLTCPTRGSVIVTFSLSVIRVRVNPASYGGCDTAQRSAYSLAKRSAMCPSSCRPGSWPNGVRLRFLRRSRRRSMRSSESGWISLYPRRPSHGSPLRIHRGSCWWTDLRRSSRPSSGSGLSALSPSGAAVPISGC